MLPVRQAYPSTRFFWTQGGADRCDLRAGGYFLAETLQLLRLNAILVPVNWSEAIKTSNAESWSIGPATAGVFRSRIWLPSAFRL